MRLVHLPGTPTCVHLCFLGLLPVWSCVSLWRMPTAATSSVKRERLRRGLTQQDLAEKCANAGVPVDESHISRIERGIFTPRPRLRALLAELLDLDIDDFERRPQPDAETRNVA
ncbi:multiprotein-bridging factor 1 family protein [Streptomyces sp. NPDC087787]|uniref:helix-turn-helix domain-containing protein n=1 Tax=Streptomyces sp. NPDC087787 TaxID=3365803 RepID=UPI003827D0BF